MSEFKQYTRTNVAEMRPVTEAEINGLIASSISISKADEDNGSPKLGDMIARNPNNHEDQWLVAEAYFKDNFEEKLIGLKEAMNGYKETWKDGIHITFSRDEGEPTSMQIQAHNISGLEMLAAVNGLLNKVTDEMAIPRSMVLLAMEQASEKMQKENKE